MSASTKYFPENRQIAKAWNTFSPSSCAAVRSHRWWLRPRKSLTKSRSAESQSTSRRSLFTTSRIANGRRRANIVTSKDDFVLGKSGRRRVYWKSTQKHLENKRKTLTKRINGLRIIQEILPSPQVLPSKQTRIEWKLNYKTQCVSGWIQQRFMANSA